MFNIFTSINQDKRGFTLIELTVILIVLGSFILLAGPRFISLIELAEETRIQNDVRVAENLSVLEIYKNGFDLSNDMDGKLEVTNSIEEAVEKGRAYDIQGKIQNMDNIGRETYYQLDRDFIENDLRTNLKGKFLSTNDAKVIYIETEDTGSTLQDKAKNIRVALLDKISNKDSYELAEPNTGKLEEIANQVGIDDAEELIESYTSLLSSIK